MPFRRARYPLAILFALAAALCLLSTPAFAGEVPAPGPPAWSSPDGGLCAKLADVRVAAGSSTTSMSVMLNGALVGSAECTAGQVVSFGTVSMPGGVSTLRVVASNGAGGTATFDYLVRRIEYPWPTCIVIDKSDFRLYWIRNGFLVKVYAIAHGKPRTPTPSTVWKVGRKEKTPPRGVYGPRKLRLFRRVTYRSRHGRVVVRYKYTNYGIHGTNEPWVIGTRASHGCIRLRNSQILDLWPQVPVGTPVLTRQ